MEMVAQLRESQVVSENGQEKVVDLSKASREATSSTSKFSSLTSKFILPTASTPVSDAFKTQMELLQAGLSRTPTRHLLNGSLMDGEPPMKRRRGRRKNVEGLDLFFTSHKRTAFSAVSWALSPAMSTPLHSQPWAAAPTSLSNITPELASSTRESELQWTELWLILVPITQPEPRAAEE